MKTSVSDSALTRNTWKAKPNATGALGMQPEEEEPEFYLSDLLKVLEEKTNYMTLLLEAEDEIALLKEQLARCGDPVTDVCTWCLTQSERAKSCVCICGAVG